MSEISIFDTKGNAAAYIAEDGAGIIRGNYESN